MDYKEEFDRIAIKAIKKQAEKRGVPVDQVRLKFFLKQEKKIRVGYRYLINLVPDIEEAQFVKDILFVPLDLKGYSLLVPPFLKKLLLQFSEELDISVESVNVWVLLIGEQVHAFVFNEDKMVKSVDFEELFSESNTQEVMLEQMREHMEGEG